MGTTWGDNIISSQEREGGGGTWLDERRKPCHDGERLAAGGAVMGEIFYPGFSAVAGCPKATSSLSIRKAARGSELAGGWVASIFWEVVVRGLFACSRQKNRRLYLSVSVCLLSLCLLGGFVCVCVLCIIRYDTGHLHVEKGGFLHSAGKSLFTGYFSRQIKSARCLLLTYFFFWYRREQANAAQEFFCGRMMAIKGLARNGMQRVCGGRQKYSYNFQPLPGRGPKRII